MANIRLGTQSEDFGLLNQESSNDQDSETSEEEMPRPWRNDLLYCKPKIVSSACYYAPAEDRKALETLQSSSEELSELRHPILQLQVGELQRQVNFCVNQGGSEDYWLHFVIQPILNLALELSGLKDTVLAVPLKTVTISPSSLITQWMETPVSRKVDLGLVIKLENDDVNHRIANFADEEDRGGIGPALSEATLQTHPLFCHIEAKEQHQVIDPIVQLGIWTSTVYTRWEQVKARYGSSRDLPISFGWTIEGSVWRLHVIRQLADGSRRITENSRVYDIRFTPDIYLVIAMLRRLIAYGNQEFREQFLDSVLDIRLQDPVGSNAPHIGYWDPWRVTLVTIAVVMFVVFV